MRRKTKKKAGITRRQLFKGALALGTPAALAGLALNFWQFKDSRQERAHGNEFAAQAREWADGIERYLRHGHTMAPVADQDMRYAEWYVNQRWFDWYSPVPGGARYVVLPGTIDRSAP